jgi:hypothetical protein
MKYLLMIYQNPAAFQAFAQEERDAIFDEVGVIMDELSKTGEWVGGEALADPSQAKTVHVRDGVPAVTDGPFAEAKEQFVGYCIFQCETPERALEVAARWPDARVAGVELRPILDVGGTEM